MLVQASANAFVDDTLEAISRVLQLSPAHEALARKEYMEVAGWLAMPGTALDRRRLEVFPQGSLRIGTTLPPLGRNEFDLDIVAHMNGQRDELPDHIYSLVFERLNAHPHYSQVLQRKNRCVCLNYSGRFHLDVLPCIPDDEVGDTAILIPDRERKAWRWGDPKGFATWFDMRAVARTDTIIRGHVEPLRIKPAANKATLPRSVQLIKRARDVAYEKTSEVAPPSIVLTTLAGWFYDSEPLCFDAMVSIVDRIATELAKPKMLIVVNPVNTREHLSERWEKDPQLYAAFKVWIADFQRQLDELGRARGVAAIQLLKQIFGEQAVSEAYRQTMAPIQAARESGSLHVATATGALTMSASTGSVTVPRNTFYGD